MTIEADAQKDLPLGEEDAKHVTGGRRRSSRSKAGAGAATSTVLTAQPAPVAVPTAADASNAPLPISPFGDDCIPVEYGSDSSTSE
jgi:hypothetical protein